MINDEEMLNFHDAYAKFTTSPCSISCEIDLAFTLSMLTDKEDTGYEDNIIFEVHPTALLTYDGKNLHSQRLNNLPDDFAFIACQGVNAELIQNYFTIDPEEHMWKVSYWNESMTDNQTLLDLATAIRTIREVEATVTCESSQREFRLVFVHFPQSEAIVLRPFGDECPPEMECLEDRSPEHETLFQLLGIDLNAKIWQVD